MRRAKSSVPGSREQEMAAVLQALEASGLTTAEYARREGISAGLLYTWRHRLAARPSSRRSPGTRRGDPLALIPVDVHLPDRALQADGRITLELTSGDKIHVPEGASPAEVEGLIGVLRRCC